MRHEITPELAGAFIRRAAALGYEVRRLENDPELCLSAFWEGQEICRFEKWGAMRYFEREPHERERWKLHSLLLSMKEAHDLYRDARPLEADGVEGFRIISEYGDVLLAAKMDKYDEVRYVTWDYSYDRTGVTVGHYFETNYEGAKRDFAIRAGLISQDQVFAEEERKMLYAACVFYGEHDGEMTYGGEKEFMELVEKLEDSLPEQMVETVLERTAEAAPEQSGEQGQEDEHGIQ